MSKSVLAAFAIIAVFTMIGSSVMMVDATKESEKIANGAGKPVIIKESFEINTKQFNLCSVDKLTLKATVDTVSTIWEKADMTHFKETMAGELFDRSTEELVGTISSSFEKRITHDNSELQKITIIDKIECVNGEEDQTFHFIIIDTKMHTVTIEK